MKCDSCERCTSLKYDNNKFSIGCYERGNFEIHQDYSDNFECEDYVVRTTPVKENVYIVLKSGRDFYLKDSRIKTLDDLTVLFMESENVVISNLMFKGEEVACYGVI